LRGEFSARGIVDCSKIEGIEEDTKDKMNAKIKIVQVMGETRYSFFDVPTISPSTF
jgi:hypothetical protein